MINKTALLLLLTAATAVSPEIRYFHYQRPLDRNTSPSGQSCLVLDPGIYSHSASDLADLRLYADDVETPYAIYEENRTQPSSESHQPLNLGKKAGQTAFDVAMPTTGYSDIELDVKAQDFLASVQVTASKSLSDNDQTDLGSFTIFDFTKQKLGRSTVLHLPQSNFALLHFRIQGSIVPENIAGLTINRAPLRKTIYTLVAESNQSKTTGRTTQILFNLPAHTPVDRIEFLTGAEPENFSRDVTVRVKEVPQKLSTGEDAPQHEAQSAGSILRLHRLAEGHRIDEERLAIDAPFINFDRPSTWTIEIANRDDAPLPITAVRLEMQQRQLCFDALANKNYNLYYGDSALTPPQYDYAQLFTIHEDAALVKLAAEQPNPLYEPRPDTRPFTDRHPALLWIVLVLVVALLGVFAIKSSKPNPSDEEK